MSDTTYCLGGRPYSQTINESKVERINPKTKRKNQSLEDNAPFVVEINLRF